MKKAAESWSGLEVAEVGEPETMVKNQRGSDGKPKGPSRRYWKITPQEAGYTPEFLASVKPSTDTLNPDNGKSKIRQVITIRGKTYVETGACYQNHCIIELVFTQVTPLERWQGESSTEIRVNPEDGHRGLIATLGKDRWVLSGPEGEVAIVMPEGFKDPAMAKAIQQQSIREPVIKESGVLPLAGATPDAAEVENDGRKRWVALNAFRKVVAFVRARSNAGAEATVARLKPNLVLDLVEDLEGLGVASGMEEVVANPVDEELEEPAVEASELPAGGPASVGDIVRCNVCGWAKPRSDPSPCPEKHAGGFGLAGPIEDPPKLELVAEPEKPPVQPSKLKQFDVKVLGLGAARDIGEWVARIEASSFGDAERKVEAMLGTMKPPRRYNSMPVQKWANDKVAAAGGFCHWHTLDGQVVNATVSPNWRDLVGEGFLAGNPAASHDRLRLLDWKVPAKGVPCEPSAATEYWDLGPGMIVRTSYGTGPYLIKSASESRDLYCPECATDHPLHDEDPPVFSLNVEGVSDKKQGHLNQYRKVGGRYLSISSPCLAGSKRFVNRSQDELFVVEGEIRDGVVMGPAPETPQSPTRTLDTDELLVIALNRRTGMAERWQAMQRDGASDLEVRAAIGRAFDLGKVEYVGTGGVAVDAVGGSIVEGSSRCCFAGGKNPRFWSGKDDFSGRPTLESVVLVKRVRREMAIPDETGAMPTARKK